MTAQPSVLYYCACNGATGTTDAQHSDSSPPLSPTSPLLALRAFPIEKLYYCDDCSTLRCPQCVIEEPAGYHCPNCLFDVPTASVRSEKNSCARNCFQCPMCTHVLSVVEGDSEISDNRPYSLACSVCFWDSRSIGWAFEKATGISGQIERIKAGDGAVKEYANLLEHWRAVQRAAAGSSVRSMGGSAALKGGRVAAVGEPAPPYEAAHYADTDHVKVTDRMAIESADSVPYHGTGERAEPQRVRLHMKVARRCRQCHHILIKPESKAQMTRFKIQLVAMHFLPRITVPMSLGVKSPASWSPLRAGTTAPVVLRFANPLYTDMHVEVECHADSEDALVGIIAHRFSLPPFTELWEYEDDEDDVVEGRGAAQMAGEGVSQGGIVEKHGNRIAILVKVAAVRKTDNLVLPFLVTCKHVDDMEQAVEGEGSSEPLRTITNSFWTYISLGPVQ